MAVNTLMERLAQRDSERRLQDLAGRLVRGEDIGEAQVFSTLDDTGQSYEELATEVERLRRQRSV